MKSISRKSSRNRIVDNSCHDRLIAFVNRKKWWHVPPRDPLAYKKRGKFFASSYLEAEFWGLPIINAQRVDISRPLVGDEPSIEQRLFGKRVARDDITITERFKLDARIKNAALRLGYDSILLMSTAEFARFRKTHKVPRSLELNVLEPILERRWFHGTRANLSQR